MLVVTHHEIDVIGQDCELRHVDAAELGEAAVVEEAHGLVDAGRVAVVDVAAQAERTTVAAPSNVLNHSLRDKIRIALSWPL